MRPQDTVKLNTILTKCIVIFHVIHVVYGKEMSGCRPRFSFSLFSDEYSNNNIFRATSCSSVQSLDQPGSRGDLTHDSAEILFQSVLQEAVDSSSGIGRDVLSLTLSTKH